MAVDTVRLANGLRRRRGSRMTTYAPAVVVGSLLLTGCFMGIVAREARQSAAALSKTRALAQVDGLVPHIPGIVPVDGHTLGSGRPVTLAAEVVQLRRRKVRRISDVRSRRFSGVRGSRAVTSLAAYPRFADPRLSRIVEGDRAGGMTFK